MSFRCNDVATRYDISKFQLVISCAIETIHDHGYSLVYFMALVEAREHHHQFD